LKDVAVGAPGNVELRLRPGIDAAPPSLRALRCATEVTVFPATLSSNSPEPYEDWLVDGVTSLVAELRDWCGGLRASDVTAGSGDQARRSGLLAVIVERGMSSPHDEAAEAFVEAMRGIVQCIALEFAHTGLTIACVAVDDDQHDDLATTARHMGSAAGVFMAGASFDLRTRA